ncbi:hypothetical protein CYLTODRAFT_422665 [Cylindrobasidium torrendii FP15055 ss-10]|uniref:DNA binding protein Ncp1 n=1 Tax=Cylindrobasidium torrendii FP15055 ss-10 TaxID=1314674 RepID=A0A0D7BAL1_9AGAR|nr:hypothetical protein CYLTODRAFT_422665 [Cylindrobasidium torrendii FP15055 ss-10]
MSVARTSPDLDKPVHNDVAPTGEPTPSGPSDTNVQIENSPVAIHPNGSEGWLPAADAGDGEEPSAIGSPKTSVLRRNTLVNRAPSRAASTRSRGSHSRTQSIGGVSLGRKSVFSNADGRPVSGSTFINGAGTTGPSASAEADESLAERAATADGVLSAKQQSRIKKNEVKDGRRLSKVIKMEGKVERQALGLAIRELGELQKIQKDAVKREEKAHTGHMKTISAYQKCEEAFLAARAALETAQAQMNAASETLDVARSNALEATEAMQEKSQEIDALRTMNGVDAREREVKLVELSGKSQKTKKGWFN